MQSSDPLSLDGRVAIVTGAGAGLGKAEALALARAGAHVVLNDLPGAAEEAAEEIRAAGGLATVVAGDVGERSTADALLAATADDLGRLDVVVNNAGVIRDRMLFNMSDEEWDLVIKVHLRGHFLLSRNAASYWRGLAKSTGAPVYGSVVNTASEAFLVGSPGQPNYAAAKGGITALTLSTARGLGRSGVRANAICPRARTAMTEQVFGEDTSGRADRPALPGARRAAGGLPRVAGGRADHRPGVRRVRRDGGAARGPRRRTPLRRLRRDLGPARPRQAARLVLRGPRPLGRLRRRRGDEHRRPAARLTSHDPTRRRQTGIDMGRLSGKVAIVTGGAQGQGAAIVRGFVAEGAKVVIADIATDEGELLAKEIGDDAVFVRHDVTSEADWEATVATAKERFGQRRRADQQRRHPDVRRADRDVARGLRAGHPDQPVRHLPRHALGRRRRWRRPAAARS